MPKALTILPVVALLLTAGVAAQLSPGKPKAGVPMFEVAPSWLKLPANMKLGSPSGLAIDGRDHLWIVNQRADPTAMVPLAASEQAAPPVVEVDAAGRYVQGWGGPGDGYEWTTWPHGIFVDYQDNIWIGARGTSRDKPEHQIYKFTRTGKFLLQIGHRGKGKGSTDTENLGNAADTFVYPKTNEVLVADGYLNRRIIVFDATTGAFRRYWGAYGNKPDDARDREDTQQFLTVHQVRVSNDGLAYVALLGQGRVQIFTLDGKFLKEIQRDWQTEPKSGITAVAFSPDRQQQFLYVNDFGKQEILIFDRQTLEQVGTVGRPGTGAGELNRPHHIALDSKSNLYVSELGGRIQRFDYKGLSKP